MPLASKLAAQEQAKRSQILSLSLSSHLGNGNLYLQTVGAGGEHEISNRHLSLSAPPSSLPWPASPLTSYAPSRASHQRNASQKRPSPVVRSLDRNKSNVPISEQRRRRVLQPLFTFLALTRLLTGDRRVEKHQFFWILTLMQTKKKSVPGGKGEGRKPGK